MKFPLYFKHLGDIPVSKTVTKVLSWFIMAFGVFCIIVGAVVRDDIPAAAQQPAEISAAAPTVQGAPIPAVQDIPAGTDQVPSAVPPQVQVPEAQHAAPDQTAQAAPEAVQVQVPEAQHAAPAQNAQAAPVAVQVQVPEAQPAAGPDQTAQAAPVAAPEPVKKSVSSIIEEKQAKDETSILSRIMSIVGIFAFIGIGYLMSSSRKKILWKLVAVGTVIQLVFAVFILWTPVGKAIFSFLNDAVNVLLGFTNAGTEFLFSSFVTGSMEPAFINTAMSILPPIIFFSSLMTVLYHLGVMQWIVKGMAGFMMKLMGTSGSESLSSVANIFVGMTEAPLVIRPYIATMTHSELFAVMTGGMATVAGGVMASYVAMLQPVFPDIAGHLIAASVMSAPASLVVAKLIIPETEESETMGKVKLDMPKTDANVIDAAARGAGEGMTLALNVASMLLAFVAIIALINFILGLPSRLVNANTYEHVEAYVIQEGGEADPKCAAIYSTSDTIACTHGALMQLAEIRNLPAESITGLDKLSGDQSAQIDTTEKLYNAVIAADPGHAQNDDPALEKKSIWPLLSLETILGWIFFPFAFIMGVPLSDCFLVGQLLGQKMAVNEFVAYLHLSQVVDMLSYRSIVISTYALCGFANFGSIAIQIGGIGGMAPSRRSDIAKLGIKSMIAGTIAAFMTATIAGALI